MYRSNWLVTRSYYQLSYSCLWPEAPRTLVSSGRDPPCILAMPSQRTLARARRQRAAAAASTEPAEPEPSSGSDDARPGAQELAKFRNRRVLRIVRDQWLLPEIRRRLEDLDGLLRKAFQGWHAALDLPPPLVDSESSGELSESSSDDEWVRRANAAHWRAA